MNQNSATLKNRVLKLIAAIRGSRSDNAHFYTHGGCWQFHLILKAAFPEARPLFDWRDGGHVVTEISGQLYDINGAYIATRSHRVEIRPIDPNIAKTAHRWLKQPRSSAGDVLRLDHPPGADNHGQQQPTD